MNEQKIFFVSVKKGDLINLPKGAFSKSTNIGMQTSDLEVKFYSVSEQEDIDDAKGLSLVMLMPT